MSGTGGAVLTEDGCRLWSAQTGQGTPLVLCHGGPGLWDMFDTLAPLLAGHARLVRWDQRGCGRSERRGPTASPGRSLTSMPSAATLALAR